MPGIQDSPLGRRTAAPDRYAPELLFAVPRAEQRAALGLGATLPFTGVDVWNAYELSWLDPAGKPRVALAELRVPAESPNLVESKSLKLYLNALAGERYACADAVAALLAADLSRTTGAPVAVLLTEPGAFPDSGRGDASGTSIDDTDVAIGDYGPPNAGYLVAGSGNAVDETLVSNLFRSNCPVTGQPDWATIAVSYRGAPIDRAGLLRYLVSFRGHHAFHEHCAERIFVDVLARCAPQRLAVEARFTRRGGIDINPWRSTHPGTPSNSRLARQ